MEKQFRVMVLVKETESSSYAYIKTIGGRDRGDALMSALIEHAGRGGDLNKVVKTSVVELKTEKVTAPKTAAPKVAPRSGLTMVGLSPIQF